MTKKELRQALNQDVNSYVTSGGIISTIATVQHRKQRGAKIGKAVNSNSVYQNSGNNPRLKAGGKYFTTGFKDEQEFLTWRNN